MTNEVIETLVQEMSPGKKLSLNIRDMRPARCPSRDTSIRVNETREGRKKDDKPPRGKLSRTEA